MLSDEDYELCRTILDNKDVEQEDKIEKLEELLTSETSLRGSALENAVLDALWRDRNASRSDKIEAPLRHTAIRKSSPAPWQMHRAPTPVGTPPIASSPSLSTSRPSFSRQRSSISSPWVSPRPSPRLAYAQPIPHSPSLNAYAFSEDAATPDVYGDLGSDNVDWLVGDDTASNTSSTGTGNLSAAAPEWVPQPDMSPYDILRSVLGDKNTDDEIEDALEKNAYDLGATIAALIGGDQMDIQQTAIANQDHAILVGRSMVMQQARPTTPGSGKSPVVCKYWLQSGSCLRADCRFSHDTSGNLCKYWMAGQCLAGSSCNFSHDPALLLKTLQLNNSSESSTASSQTFQMQDHPDQFPALLSSSRRSSNSSFTTPSSGAFPTFTPMSYQRGRGAFAGARPTSRPSSRHQNRPEIPSSLSMDDHDAFPTLSSLNAKRTSKHHGHRPRHGHSSQDREAPSSLAEVVKFMPAAPSPQRKPEINRKKPPGGSDGGAARRIPEPKRIPWLETGDQANAQYLKHRADAIKHGSVRNKFLQSAAQAWNRNDARAAKALSLRGQAENEAMRKAHREAARALYEERNQHLKDGFSDDEEELYADLHGLHPEEAIEYLGDILHSHSKRGRKVIYAITGTGHHSKNGKDKVGKSVRTWLGEEGYVFREFSVPGERGGYIGGVLGIDVSSRQPGTLPKRAEETPISNIGGKIQLLKREELPG